MRVKMEVMSPTDLTPTTLREAFGHFPSGVIAIAAEVGGARVGLAASTFVPVSLDPPLVSFCLDRRSSSWPTLEESPFVGVHVLTESQEHLARRFATSGIDRFAEPVRWSAGPHGVPVLEGALAVLVCRVAERVHAGDHAIVLAEPVQGMHAEGAPLLYHDGRYLKAA
jgi:flavin reductase (DIM6/NTAB) family NADH-FMN oxidoreductase RutF